MAIGYAGIGTDIYTYGGFWIPNELWNEAQDIYNTVVGDPVPLQSVVGQTAADTPRAVGTAVGNATNYVVGGIAPYVVYGIVALLLVEALTDDNGGRKRR